MKTSIAATNNLVTKGTLASRATSRAALEGRGDSLLGAIAEDFLKGSHNTGTLLSDIVSRYLDVTGFSSGAIYLVDQESRFDLAAESGFASPVRKSLPDFFGHDGMLREVMRKGEPLLISRCRKSQAPFASLPAHLRAKTLLIVPLVSDPDPVGVLVLLSKNAELNQESLPSSKAVGRQIGQAIAFSRGISRLQSLASYDPLTELPNRAHLRERLLQTMATGKPAALYLLNLDRFEEINNTLSYHNGDLLLRQVAARLKATLSDRAIVARLGADEFAVLVSEATTVDSVERTAREILKSLDSAFRLDGLLVAVRASMGIALFPKHGEDADTLLSRADMARRASRKTGNNYVIYPAHIDQYNPDHLILLGELREAIERDNLALHYQPKVSLKTGAIIGVEALVRWHHPKRGWIPPDQFIYLAEKTGLIHPLTLWVLGSALRQARHWRDAGLEIAVAVNVSARDLQEPAFPDYVAQVFQSTGISPNSLTIELTERALMNDPAKANAVVERLSEMGVHFSIDDFGTGYSSLSYLQKLPAGEIKIDRFFVGGLRADPRCAAIVRSIIDLGRDLDLTVVAEGIEDQQTSDYLAALGCSGGQGYHICRPLPADELLRWAQVFAAGRATAQEGPMLAGEEKSTSVEDREA